MLNTKTDEERKLKEVMEGIEKDIEKYKERTERAVTQLEIKKELLRKISS